MFVVSFSPSAVSTTVWAQAVRSLTVDPATDAGAATLVWGHAARGITSIKASYTEVTQRASVLTATILDLRPAAGVFRTVTLAGGLSNGTSVAGVYDGTNFDGTFNASSQQAAATYVGGATRGPAVHNTSGSTQTVGVAGWDTN